MNGTGILGELWAPPSRNSSAISAANLGSVMAEEFYHSDIALSPIDPADDVKFEQNQVGLLRITCYSSRGGVKVSRTWDHIRQDNRNFYVLWFVTEGSFEIRQGQNTAHISPSTFSFTSSSKPATFVGRPGDSNDYVTYQILVPSHIMLKCLPHAPHLCGRVFPLSEGTAKMSFKILMSIFSEADGVSDDLASKIGLQAIEGLLRVAAGEGYQPPLSLREERAGRLLEYIQLHLNEPNLTADRVAAANQVSVRYLHCLLADRGTNLRDEIWGARLSRAKDVLTDPSYQQLSVTEIAYMVGFRSLSHFSRSFRMKFGKMPSELRKEAIRH